MLLCTAFVANLQFTVDRYVASFFCLRDGARACEGIAPTSGVTTGLSQGAKLS